MTTPSQQYVYVQKPQSGPQSRTAGGSQGQSRTGSGSAGQNAGSGSPKGQQKQVKLPAHVPRVFANEYLVFGAWIAAMIIVCFDEWHNYGILPRPSRLWYTSVTFGILAILGIFSGILPLVNALAVGFTIMLLWQYYNGSGQFSKTTGAAT